nr:CoA pyrophosphatase [Microbacterium bovistercoris]
MKAPQTTTDVRSALAALGRTGFDWRQFASERMSVNAELARRSAVLILFGPLDGVLHGDGARPDPVDPAHADVLLLRRASSLLHHPGQIGFPGGGVEPADGDIRATAVREAVEETGLDPDGLELFDPLPDLPLAVSNHLVTPVPAWWRHPSPVHAVDAAETAEVFRAPVARLLDPANRVNVTRMRGVDLPPMPAFELDGRLIWGFTAIILSGMFDTLGWTVPWDAARTVEPDV